MFLRTKLLLILVTFVLGLGPVTALAQSWDLSGNAGTDPTINFLGTTDDTPLEIRVNNIRVMRWERTPVFGNRVNVIGGGASNSVASGVSMATICGGGDTIEPQTVTGPFGTIGGGAANTAGSAATVAGGEANGALAPDSTVAGGFGNLASGQGASVAGGSQNVASGDRATVAGGFFNVASGNHAFVAGGRGNQAEGDFSFAAGLRARAAHAGAFVFGDSTQPDLDLVTSAPDQFVLRFANGGALYTSSDLTSGVVLDPGGNQWSSVSDVAAKSDFASVDVRALVAKLAEIPIPSWSYKTENPAIRHIGPMAQDFYAAFGVGVDDRHIGTLDQGGIALAAIQGLHQLLQDKDAEIVKAKVAMQQEIDALKERLTKLEALLAP